MVIGASFLIVALISIVVGNVVLMGLAAGGVFWYADLMPEERLLWILFHGILTIAAAIVNSAPSSK